MLVSELLEKLEDIERKNPFVTLEDSFETDEEPTVLQAKFDYNYVGTVRHALTVGDRLELGDKFEKDNPFASVDVQDLMDFLRKSDDLEVVFHADNMGVYPLKKVKRAIGNWGDGDGDYDYVELIFSEDKE